MRSAALLVFLAACRPAVPPPAPAKAAASLSKEGDLVVVSLSEEAEKRLGLRTAAVETKELQRSRERGGDVLVPPGAAVAVAAPFAGMLSGEVARAGSPLKKGQPVFTLTPLLSPESRATLAAARVDAEGAVEGAKILAEAAKIELARAERLLQEKAGSRRGVDEASARSLAAEAARRAAEARRDVLASAVGGTLGPVPVAAPFDGVLYRTHAAPGQQVAAGAALFDVANLDRIWIRVPVYVGDLGSIDASREILVEGRAAKPVAAPPAADPLASTADLVYEVENTPLQFRPGQKVAVPLPLRSAGKAATLPAGAILYDIHGGTWVYARTAPLKYVRRRVRVARVDGPVAVLDGELPAGTEVVVEGAAELFGTEFYVNK